MKSLKQMALVSVDCPTWANKFRNEHENLLTFEAHNLRLTVHFYNLIIIINYYFDNIQFNCLKMPSHLNDSQISLQK